MIEAKNLTMHYGSVHAVEDVSFKIGEHEVVGFLGPNGAGKTTLMRLLTTFIHPTRGTAIINGVDVVERPIEARRHLGYLPETPPLYSDMRVDEFLEFIGRARGLDRKMYKTRRDWVTSACGLAPVWKHTIYELSLGFRQRVGLAQALLHDPKVVILDEPTSGLDPIQIISIRNLIQELSKTKTILFSSHILQEVSAISNRILIINHGRLALQGTVSDLRAAAVKKEEVFRVTLDGSRSDVAQAFTSSPALKRAIYMEDYQGSPRFSIVGSSYGDVVRVVNEISAAKGWKLKELVREEPSLEDVFIDSYRRSAKKTGAAIE